MSKSNFFIVAKRRRDEEEEVYFDNYHTQKRYLTEIMASSMNGLSVSESDSVTQQPSSPLADPMLSSSETVDSRDETSIVDALMLENGDESVGYQSSLGFDMITKDLGSSYAPSSGSLRRFQRLPCNDSAKVLPGSLTWACSRILSTPYTPSAWPRSSDKEGRILASPNDPSQTGDLRRATLLRNLAMQAQLLEQPTSSTKEEDKNLEEQDFVDEGSDQSSPNPMACQSHDSVLEQSGWNVPLLGSPTHRVVQCHHVHGSPRIRSLVLDADPIIQAAVLTAAVPFSNKVYKVITNVDQESTTDEESSYHKSPRTSRNSIASSGDDISSSLSPTDGNAPCTDSSFSARSASLHQQSNTSLFV